MARNVTLIYSPDECLWYYQKQNYDGKVSVKTYTTKAEALIDYYFTDDPNYKWE